MNEKEYEGIMSMNFDEFKSAARDYYLPAMDEMNKRICKLEGRMK
jgi:hypothetical protein